jgi:hypothetical protein
LVHKFAYLDSNLASLCLVAMPKVLDAQVLAKKQAAAAETHARAQSQFWFQASLEMMKAHPDVRQRCHAYLTSLLEVPVVGPVIEAEVPTLPDAWVWLPQYTKLGVTPSKFLKKLCQACDPITYSDGNLRSLCAKNQRDVPHEPLCEILEFNTDWQKGMTIAMESRSLQAMETQAAERYQANGCRGGKLRLPPDWVNDGLWMLDDRRLANGGKVWAKQRYGKLKSWMPIPVEFVGEVTIEFNFSSARAIAKEVNGMTCYSLHLLAPSSGEDLSLEAANDGGTGGAPPSKEPLMLENTPPTPAKAKPPPKPATKQLSILDKPGKGRQTRGKQQQKQEGHLPKGSAVRQPRRKQPSTPEVELPEGKLSTAKLVQSIISAPQSVLSPRPTSLLDMMRGKKRNFQGGADGTSDDELNGFELPMPSASTIG